MKRFIAFVLLFSTLICASCTGKREDGGDESKSDTAYSGGTSAVTTSTVSTQTTETSEPVVTESESEKRIKELEERLAKLEEFFNLEYKNGEYSFKDGHSPFEDIDDGDDVDVHEEYDDTAVVNAYLTGDDSALTDSKDKELLKLASGVLDEIIKDGMSDYEKELAVHDWIILKIDYDSGDLAAIPAASKYSHTPYGALKYKQAICVGFATTFKLFMDMLQIENYLVHMTESGEHAWNLVKIGGDWYHVDTTFDDTENGEMCYDNFNVTDEAVIQNGYYEENSKFPKAASVKYNYYYQNGTECGSIEELESVVKKWITSGAKESVGIIMDEDVDTEEIESALEALSETIDGDDTAISMTFPCHGDGKIVFGIKCEEASELDDDGDDVLTEVSFVTIPYTLYRDVRNA